MVPVYTRSPICPGFSRIINFIAHFKQVVCIKGKHFKIHESIEVPRVNIVFKELEK